MPGFLGMNDLLCRDLDHFDMMISVALETGVVYQLVDGFACWQYNQHTKRHLTRANKVTSAAILKMMKN